MPDLHERRPNTALWLGLLIIVLGVLSNFLYFFINFSAAIIPWINLLVPAIGLVLLLIGLRRAFTQRQIYGGRIWGSIVTVLAVALFGLSVVAFVGARNVPPSAGAPKIGQKAPDFTLADSSGQTVALSQLFSTQAGTPQPPKALLLVFYRGYW
jgi:hypothetical protein